MSRAHVRRRGLVATAVAAGLAVSAAAGLVGAGQAAAAVPTAVTGATLTWGFSGEQGGGAYFGGCNFLSAGKAGNTGSSRVWTQADGFYAATAGNVTVQKPSASGAYVTAGWATKCLTPQGAPVNAGSVTSLSRNRVVFRAGTGTVNRSANTGTLRWTGSVTSVFYGGLTYWTASNPVLTVRSDKTATLTATASGYGADRNDPGRWVTIAPRTITLATLKGVTLTSTGFTVTPGYLGVKVSVPGGTPQVPKTPENASYWGSFPQSFVAFQQLTGQSSYWYTSGGTRDGAKPALPISVAYRTAAGATVNVPSEPAPSEPVVTSSAPVATTPPPTRKPEPASTAAATLTVAGPAARPGTPVAFTAGGFGPDEGVTIALDPEGIELARVRADATGRISASRTVPVNVPAGEHRLVLRGVTSNATASATLAVSPRDTGARPEAGAVPSPVPAAAAARAAAPAAALTTTTADATTTMTAAGTSDASGATACTPSTSVTGGSLVWGFKRSYRAYVAGGSGTSITAAQGASILAEDLAVAGRPDSGALRWPFASSVSYTSPERFSIQYAGSVEFRYPSHYFTTVFANPKVTVDGASGTLTADVRLTSSSPGQQATTSERKGVALATLTAGSPQTGAGGVSRTMRAALADTAAFTMNGSAFYQRGQALDDATVLLAGCSASSGGIPAGGGSTPAAGDPSDGPPGGAGAAGGGDESLIPDIKVRGDASADPSDALPFTGFRAETALAVAACACAAGLLFLTVATRRPRRAGSGAVRPAAAGDER